jgi:hypothetical protein
VAAAQFEASRLQPNPSALQAAFPLLCVLDDLFTSGISTELDFELMASELQQIYAIVLETIFSRFPVVIVCIAVFF